MQPFYKEHHLIRERESAQFYCRIRTKCNDNFSKIFSGPGICGKNQIWDMCGVNQCNQQFCYERFGDDIACIALCDEQNPGCRCETGFYLDDQSNCIPEKDCKIKIPLDDIL